MLLTKEVNVENQARLTFVEIMLYWQGSITTTQLVKQFSVSRQTASKDINQYISLFPANVAKYDPKKQFFEPTCDFQPKLSQGLLTEYVELVGTSSVLEAVTSSAHAGIDTSTNSTHFQMLPMPLRNINPTLVRSLIYACQQQKRLSIGYYSIKSGVTETRIISPHSIVFDGVRWHVRAYCERRDSQGNGGGFKDFVLSRFHGEAEIEDFAPSHTRTDDTEWNHIVPVLIEPDARLDANRRKAIEMDYMMSQGQLTIPCRAALVKYLMQQLRLDHYNPAPEGQQIVLEQNCWHRLEPYRLS